MRLHAKRLTAASVLLLCAGCGSDDGEDRLRSSNVIVSERMWTDASRDVPRTPTRMLRTLIWHQEGAQRLPLLILAHGFGGLPEKLDAFARALAGAGFVVAAPAFPLTNEGAPGGHQQGLSDFRNQPADVSFVLTRLIETSGDQDDALFESVDVDRVAVLGHSLGGLTALAATRKDCCRDPRIKAVIAVAPLIDLFLSQFGNDPIDDGPPTLIVHGQADTAIAVESSLNLYEAIDSPRFLIELAGAGHSDPLETQELPAPPARRATEEATITFLNAVHAGVVEPYEAILDQLAANGHVVRADW